MSDLAPITSLIQSLLNSANEWGAESVMGREALRMAAEMNSALAARISKGDILSQYNIHGGNIGSVGDNAQSTNIFIQEWDGLKNQIDLKKIAAELSHVNAELSKQSGSADAPLKEVIEGLAKAEDAAKQNDGPKMLEGLKAAGPIVREIFTKLSATALVELIKHVTLGG